VPEPIHIIEPTLASDAGHCRSFVESLCRAGRDPRAFRVWCGRGAALRELEQLGIAIERRFDRRVRRFQEWAVLRRLLREPGRILIPTGGRTDFLLLDWAARGRIPPRKAFVYLHWFRSTPRKLAQLRRVARRQPEIVVIGSTPTVDEAFATAGFAHRTIVPYPATSAAPLAAGAAAFRHVLFAGAARADKGFSHVVGLVERLGDRADLPVVLQTATEPNDRHDERTRGALVRLAAARSPALSLRGETLDADAYAALFPGAICLQPYDPVAFADRVSSVTLDAFSAGAPVVTIPGSWIARTVERFGAGAVAPSPAPEDLLRAVERVREAYPRHAEAALAAARTLRGDHDSRRIVEVVES
jgi:hypothetical protein